MSTENGIRLESDGPIATITIDRPTVRNALDLAAARALMAAVDAVESDPAVRVAVLTGAGDVAFSAGADLRARERGEPRASIEPFGFGGFVRKPRRKPVVAAVNGFAFGGGFEIAMACDLVVVARTAHFALPEVARGLVAGGDCLPALVQRVPAGLAADLALTGRRLAADEAFTAGLVAGVADDALKAARELAESIAANAPLAVQATLTLLRTLTPATPPGYHDLVDAIQLRLQGTDDAAEGSRAFLEKRTPVWSGR